MKSRFGIGRIVMFIILGALAVFVFGSIVMLLWNNILSPVLNISTITFLQALGILVLSKILFGGFRGGWGPRRYYWKRRMMQKWNNMTPEERERLKQEWQSRCGSWSYKGWSEGSASEPGVASSESAKSSTDYGI